jgi:hypothetical protein
MADKKHEMDDSVDIDHEEVNHSLPAKFVRFFFQKKFRVHRVGGERNASETMCCVAASFFDVCNAIILNPPPPYKPGFAYLLQYFWLIYLYVMDYPAFLESPFLITMPLTGWLQAVSASLTFKFLPRKKEAG